MNKLFRACILAATTLLGIACAWAQTAGDYPNKPIRMILPSAPGGGGDMVGRLLADNLSKRLNQPFVVENNAGASGTIAINQLSKAKPDGYTIGLGTMTTTTLAPAVYEKLPYDPIKDLTTLARIGTSPIMLLVSNDVPANNLKEFLAYVKKSPDPIQYGTWGLGSTGHFCAEVLAQKTGAKLSHVPYKGSSPVMVAMLGGEIKVAWLDMATGTAAVRSGKVKPLAMCTRRTVNFPDVATYKEQGVDFDQWTGWAVFAPAGVPKAIADKIGVALRDTVKDPAVAAKLQDWGITADFVPGEEQAAINRREVEVWKKVAKDAGMKLE
jgi:tripartite-type tricarboxylate transporter receptor subunit TctC